MNGTPTTLSGPKMVGPHAQRIPIAGEDCIRRPPWGGDRLEFFGRIRTRVYAIDAGEAKQEPSVRTICGGAVRSVRRGSGAVLVRASTISGRNAGIVGQPHLLVLCWAEQ